MSQSRSSPWNGVQLIEHDVRALRQDGVTKGRARPSLPQTPSNASGQRLTNAQSVCRILAKGGGRVSSKSPTYDRAGSKTGDHLEPRRVRRRFCAGERLGLRRRRGRRRRTAATAAAGQYDAWAVAWFERVGGKRASPQRASPDHGEHRTTREKPTCIRQSLMCRLANDFT
jgi:hypothetical protein